MTSGRGKHIMLGTMLAMVLVFGAAIAVGTIFIMPLIKPEIAAPLGFSNKHYFIAISISAIVLLSSLAGIVTGVAILARQDDVRSIPDAGGVIEDGMVLPQSLEDTKVQTELWVDSTLASHETDDRTPLLTSEP